MLCHLGPLHPCHLPPHRPFAPADEDAGGVEPTQKVLLSKPPLATAPRRREPLARGAVKGPGHAPPRTRGQVPFPEQHPPLLPQPSQNSPATAGPFATSFPLSVPCLCSCTSPDRAACPEPQLSRLCPLGKEPWQLPAQPHGIAGARPPPRAAGSDGCGRLQHVPWDSPQPQTELSPSVLAAPTHGRPGDLRGERRGRGVPADQGGGGVLVPTRGSLGWAPGEGLWGMWAGRAGRRWCCGGRGWCSGVSHSAPPLLRTDDGKGAAPAGGPGPGDGPCSPGENWAQGTHASPWQPGLPSHCSPRSPSPDAQRLRLRLPRAPRPSRPKGAVVPPGERHRVPLGEIPRLLAM